MIRQDYIKRAIEELSRAVATLVGQTKPPEEVLKVVQDAKAALPVVPGLLADLPISEWIRILPNKAALTDLALLLQYESHALQSLGRYQTAVAVSRRGLALLEQAERLEGEEKVDLKNE